MRFIGADIGGSYIKSGLLDLDSLTIGHVTRVPFPSFVQGLPPGFREVECADIVSRTREQLDRLLSIAPDCSGIVMSGQMHGAVLTDSTGKPLSNFISWQDQRVLLPHPSRQGNTFDVMLSRFGDRDCDELGRDLKPGYAISSLFWLKENQQLPAAAMVASLPDFVASTLCGDSLRCEATLAASSGAYSIVQGGWHRGLLARLGLDDLRWPEIVPYNQAIGSYRHGSRDIPCFAPVGDQQCALLGALLQPGELSLNIATGSQVSMIDSSFQLGDYQVRPFFDGRFLRTVTHIPAGRALNALIALLTEIPRAQGVDLQNAWPYIERSASRVDATDLQIDLAFFSSTAGDNGRLSSVREDNLNVGHLFRAAFENMAANYSTMAQRVCPGRSWTQLVFSGGLARKSELLRRLIQEKLDWNRARICPTAEAELLGLLCLSKTIAPGTHRIEDSLGELRQADFDMLSFTNSHG